jgi:hypothetical protein
MPELPDLKLRFANPNDFHEMYDLEELSSFSILLSLT